MRRAMGVFVVLFLLVMSVPATAAMYNISVTPFWRPGVLSLLVVWWK